MPELNGSYLPIGNTDSEQAFCFILQELRSRFGASPPKFDELRAALQQLCQEIAQFGTFNIMLSNGAALFVHCSTKLHYIVRQFPFTTAHLSDRDVTIDFAEVTTPKDRVAVIATQPLTNNETWSALAPGEFNVFVDGDVLPSM